MRLSSSTSSLVGKISVEELSSMIHRMSWWDVFLPQYPEGFTYDADGNLILDGVWHYEWDAENRLKRMQMRDEVAAVLLTGSNPWAAIDFAYDWMGRRIRKVYQTSTSDPATSGGKYGPPILRAISRDTRYVYDGWMLSMSYKTTGSSLEDQSFAWGPDLSSSYGGAGGIGGLVAYSDDEHDALNPAPGDPDFLGPMFPVYDGNGNVVKMIRFESLGGSPEVFEARESASYEYGPFGENRSTTGELGAPISGGTHQGQRNPFRFSTKFTDAETGLVYYGYRYYSPTLGRWISRDPINEADNANLFASFNNRPVDLIDSLGLWVEDAHHALTRAWLGRQYGLWKWKCCTLDVIKQINNGSDYVDGTDGFAGYARFLHGNLTETRLHEHAMRGFRETVAQARVKYNRFVNEQLSIAVGHARKARRLAQAGKCNCTGGERPRTYGSALEDPCALMDFAIFRLGMAYHAVSDDTSPAHTGFQVWRTPASFGLDATGLALFAIASHVHGSLEELSDLAPVLRTSVNKVKSRLQSQLDSLLRE